MKMFHVYKLHQHGEYYAIETTGCKSIQEVERRLPKLVNHYGVNANTPEEAIEKAIAAGFKWKSPEEMQALFDKLEELQNKLR